MNDAIAESVETSPSETAFDAKRRRVLDTLGFDAETRTVSGSYPGEHGLSGLFLHLLTLPDEAVLAALALVIAETLAAGIALIRMLGRHHTQALGETPAVR